MKEQTDAELVGLARTGNGSSYEELVARYQGHVYGLAYSLAGNWANAQDITQEAFIRAYMNLGQLRDPARFAAWLRRVTFGVAMNWLKAFRPKLFRQLDGVVDLERLEVPDFQPGPPEVAEQRELSRAVMGAVASLPPKYRVALTMFHLDGLSYRKVADFLDIPLGSAKTLIHRAKGRLRVALAAHMEEEVVPMVQEVFDEHKLAKEFPRKVLEGIPEIGWHTKQLSCFAGALTACMAFLKDPVPYDLIMGASGAGFRLQWSWAPENCDVLILGEEPLRRTFNALGYDYEHIVKDGDDDGRTRDLFQAKIAASVHGGRPVIAQGVVGPPECSVIAGYDHKGDVLLGHSYFHDGSDGYFSQADWYKDCWSLILIGRKKQAPPKRRILKDALEWAVELARTPQMTQRATGLVAYDAWADAMEVDADFPLDDLETLAFRYMCFADAVGVVWDGRRSAAAFCRRMADVDEAAGADLLAAAAAYHEEWRLMHEDLCAVVETHIRDDEHYRRLADPSIRRRAAEVVRAAKVQHQRATERLESALAALGNG